MYENSNFSFLQQNFPLMPKQPKTENPFWKFNHLFMYLGLKLTCLFRNPWKVHWAILVKHLGTPGHFFHPCWLGIYLQVCPTRKRKSNPYWDGQL